MTMLTLTETAQRLTAAGSVLVLTHRRPDGDTLGSAAALCRMLQRRGVRAFVHPNEDITPRLAPVVQGLWAPPDFVPQRIAAIDIASESLFCDSCAGFAGRVDLCIDHHPSNTGYARETLLCPRAAATGEIIWQLGEVLGDTPDCETLSALYVAVATDTGCFKFSNTTPLSHRIAAACIEGGVDFHALNREFFERKTRARFLIERHMFDTLRFYGGERIAAAQLTRDFCDSVGATGDDLDNLSTLLMQIDGVECGILLQELVKRGQYKVSVRTHKPLDASRICAGFGGGGHPRAAGCTVSGGAEQCRDMLAQAALHALEEPC